jgi:hypothetical protein
MVLLPLQRQGVLHLVEGHDRRHAHEQQEAGEEEAEAAEQDPELDGRWDVELQEGQVVPGSETLRC